MPRIVLGTSGGALRFVFECKEERTTYVLVGLPSYQRMTSESGDETKS